MASTGILRSRKAIRLTAFAIHNNRQSAKNYKKTDMCLDKGLIDLPGYFNKKHSDIPCGALLCHAVESHLESIHLNGLGENQADRRL